MRTIVITASEDGSVEIEANGFKGKACEAQLEKFITALGVATKKTPKKEFYMEDKIKQGN